MKKILGLIVVGVLALAPVAGATSFTFSTTSTVDNYGVSATASFNFTGSNLVLMLNNTTPNVLHIAQELDGISWSGFTLTGSPIVAAAGVIDCEDYSGSACPAELPMPSSPYHWGLVADKLAAGSGSYHPFAIVDTYTAPGGKGGISNSSHNPLLLGPVTFTFAYSGSPTQVTDVKFLWGTSGTPTDGVCTGDNCPPPPPPVPEPASLLLLGSGLIGAGSFARWKKR